TKTPGKSGWAPRCTNEWRPGVCGKPKVKCAECANRRFVPWSDSEARGHLEGRQTAGIYPLLAGETCWLVAIDLHGPTWLGVGGFGSLIALPLQHARRAEGCTVFLGEDLEPYPDQWVHLAGVQRLAGEQAEQITAEAERVDGTLGLPERTDTKARARPRRLAP